MGSNMLPCKVVENGFVVKAKVNVKFTIHSFPFPQILTLQVSSVLVFSMTFNELCFKKGILPYPLLNSLNKKLTPIYFVMTGTGILLSISSFIVLFFYICVYFPFPIPNGAHYAHYIFLYFSLKPLTEILPILLLFSKKMPSVLFISFLFYVLFNQLTIFIYQCLNSVLCGYD